MTVPTTENHPRLDGYTADQVRYVWSRGQREALKLHKIRLPDFRIKEAFVTSMQETYATGEYRWWIAMLVIRVLQETIAAYTFALCSRDRRASASCS